MSYKLSSHSFLAATCGTLALVAALSVPAHATWVWNGSASASWSDPSNWNGNTVPTASDTAQFDSTGASRTTLTIAGKQLIDGLSFLSGAPAYTLGGSGTLTLGTLGITNLAGIRSVQTITVSLAFTRNTIVTGTGTTLIAGEIMGNAAGLTKSGTGRLTLTNSNNVLGGALLVDGGTVALQTGGRLESQTGSIGSAANTTGTMNVSDSGSRWISDGNLNVGYQGNGTLNIVNQAAVDNTDGYVGYLSGSVGTAVVSGVGSRWTNTMLTIGKAGTGTLSASDGSRVNSTEGVLGSDANSTGTVNISGAQTQWDNSADYQSAFSTGFITVGSLGTGILSINAGGTVTDGTGYVGKLLGSSGTVTVDGAGSTWANSERLFIGVHGNGMLTISNGGKVSSSFGSIAGEENFSSTDNGLETMAVGIVRVEGVGSEWVNTKNLQVGLRGSGTLFITGGGTASSLNGNIGGFAGSVGLVTVDGGGSQWSNSSSLLVGESGNATLNIKNGGMVSNTNGYIGYNTESTSTVTVDGIGSQWKNSGALLVGRQGNATITLSNGGAVSAASVAVSGMNTINAVNGGILNTGALTGTGSIRLNNGAGNTGLVVAQSGNSTFAGEISNAIGAVGGLTKTGAGTLTLTNNNTYTGVTAITEGALVLVGASSSSGYALTSGATLQLDSGYALSNTTVSGNGTLLIGTGGAKMNRVSVGAASAPGVTVTQNGSSVLTDSTIRGTWNANANFAANDVTVNRTGTLAINTGTTTASGLETLGTLTVANGATLISNDALVSGGQTRIGTAASHGGTLRGDVIVTGGTLTNNGTITGKTTIGAGGVVKGSGNFAGGYELTEFGVFSPGNSPGTASTGSATWSGGGRYIFEINNATGTAGADWDLNAITGSLSLVPGTTPFQIRVDSLLADNTPGSLTNFDQGASYSWDIVRTTGGIVGFDPSFFYLDTAGFSALNPGANTGSWSVSRSGNDLKLNYSGVAVIVPEVSTGLLALLTAVPGLFLLARRGMFKK